MAAKPGALSAPRPSATPEPGIAALAAIYRRAIARYQEAIEDSPATAPDDAAIVKNIEGVSHLEQRTR